MDIILVFFNHPPTPCGHFLCTKRGQKWQILDHLPTPSCPRGYWMPPLVKKICSKMAALDIFFSKRSKIWHQFVIAKPAATPIFWEWNFFQIHYFGIMKFFSFCSKIVLLEKVTLTKRYFKTKFVLIISAIKCNFWGKKVHGSLSIFFAQTRLIWNILSAGSNNWHMGYKSHSVFITEHQFAIEIEKNNQI